jgi:integrase/recombinase XerD
MDQTTYSDYVAVQHGDNAPFADERYRYLRHYAEGGATAAFLKIKRNRSFGVSEVPLVPCL